ncbi:MAG: dienelactone hydrolase family protein [Acidimicrobiales bacterium]
MTEDRMEAGTIELTSRAKDQIEAYHAAPVGVEGHGSVVVIHHMPGYDPATKEIARRFAAQGYAALVPNLFHRYAPGGDPSDAAAAARAAGGVPDSQCLDDLAGAIDHLRSQPGANGRVGVIGYCSGGRQSYMGACRLDLDAAVDCYGGGVIASAEQLTPERPVAVIDMTADMACPLLGLFGAHDANPDPEQVLRTAEELKRHSKNYEFHTLEDAGHAFFWVERPSYRAEAAREGWELIWDFFARHLQA